MRGYKINNKLETFLEDMSFNNLLKEGRYDYEIDTSDKENLFYDFYFLIYAYQLFPKTGIAVTEEMETAVKDAIKKITYILREDVLDAAFGAVACEIIHFQGDVRYVQTSGRYSITINSVKKDQGPIKMNVSYSTNEETLIEIVQEHMMNLDEDSDYDDRIYNAERVFRGREDEFMEACMAMFLQDKAVPKRIDIKPGGEIMIKDQYGDEILIEYRGISYITDEKFILGNIEYEGTTVNDWDDIDEFVPADDYVIVKNKDVRAVITSDEMNWLDGYGGEAWAAICQGYKDLFNATGLRDNIEKLDVLMSLQHNSDTLFNKIERYAKDGSYSWIVGALNFKARATGIDQYYENISPQLRRLGAQVIKIISGKTLEDIKQNEKNYEWRKLDSKEIFQYVKEGTKIKNNDNGAIGKVVERVIDGGNIYYILSMKMSPDAPAYTGRFDRNYLLHNKSKQYEAFIPKGIKIKKTKRKDGDVVEVEFPNESSLRNELKNIGKQKQRILREKGGLKTNQVYYMNTKEISIRNIVKYKKEVSEDTIIPSFNIFEISEYLTNDDVHMKPMAENSTLKRYTDGIKFYITYMFEYGKFFMYHEE